MSNFYTGVSSNQIDGSIFKDDTKGLPKNYFSYLGASAYQDFFMKGEYEWAVANPCKPGTVSEIDTALRNFFNFLKGVKEYGNLHVNGVLGEAQNLTYEISKTINIVSGVLRTFTQRLRNFILGLIKELIQGAIQCLLTPLLEQIKDTVFGVILDQLMCKFDEIMNNLTDLASDFLFALVNLAINNPALCAIESFTNALLNNLANTIDTAIQPILSQIGDILGGAAQVVGSVFSVIDQVLGFEGLLCSEPKCPEEITKFKTGPFGGPQKGQSEGFSNMISSPSRGLSALNQNASQWLNETFPDNTNVSGAPCYTGSYDCGSPQVVFFGGGGSGASASSVVNGIGQIIGFNLLNGGSGYRTAPFVSIVDPAGCGYGAQAYAVMNGDKVQKVVLTTSGSQYSSVNNGSVPVINSFVGAPNPVQVGKTITLTWNVLNFDNLSLGISGYNNLKSPTGSVSFVIDESDVQFIAGSNFTTKKFTLTATKNNVNSAPQVVTQDYVFTVTKDETEDLSQTTVIGIPPVIDNFVGSPDVGTSLTPGSILTLSWNTTNADIVTLNPPPLNNPTLPLDGSVSVVIPTDITPGILTSYVLTATNTNSSTGAQSVSQVINYTIDSASIGQGEVSPVINQTPGENAGIQTSGVLGTAENNAVSFLDQIQILEGGIDYDSNDEVTIVGGNNGATFELVTTALGQIVSINILTPGYGFTSIPEIEINSKNGVGVKLLPQLQFTPLEQFLAEQELEYLDQTKLVQVIDCVYK